MVGMETAVVSAAVSGMLKIVGDKLAPLVIKQYSSIVGVTKDLKDLQGLVEEINCWLEKVGDKAIGSEPLFNWLRQLKDIAYDVDDVVDEFHLKAEKHEADGGKHIVSKYLCTKPKSFMFQCKAARKIRAIKERFAAVVKLRTDFGAIANSLPDGHPVSHINKRPGEISSLPTVDEALVLGRHQEKNEIISKLVVTNGQQIIKVVSIIGLGGGGKTILAKLVFNDGDIIKKHFEVKIWVHVSQEFDVEKLVKKLFEAISGEKSEHYPLQQMIKTISDKLSGKRYLLVLDDVWTEDRIHWEEFMVHIKSGAPGSSILLTTRNRKVAEAVDSIYPFNLPFLSEVNSWAVFRQSFGMAVKGLDCEFLEVGREIVNKCGGMPLAIKVLAGVLRDKRQIEEWKAMRDSNLLDVEDKEHRVFACLTLSYFHLPSHLKPCFTICSLFCKGHRIDKEQLIDQWISHDMIPLVDGIDYLEYAGNDCFISLVQMSFLQDVNESIDGRVTCRMHDLVHDLARYILGDEISVGVPKETTGSTKKHRYFSIIEQPGNLPPKYLFEKARAIYVATHDDFILGKALENAKHLRSVTVGSIHTISVPTAILQIKNLRYLCISGARCKTLPEAISDIWGLQTLHANFSSLCELPKSIGKLQKLRAVNLSYCEELESLPDSVGDCHMISRVDLQCCKKLTALPNSIERNKKLRVLRLGYTKIERLPTGITTLGNLECLDLQWCHELVELPEGLGNLKKLEVLNLEGCGCCSFYKMQKERWGRLGGMPMGIGQLTRLRKLGLFVVGVGKKSALLSELGTIGRIREELTISNLEGVMNPDDAYKAYLNQKTNLQILKLSWKTFSKRKKPNWLRNDAVNAENDLAVLDGLKPPSGIHVLEIDGYGGGQCPWWMLGQVGSGVQGLPHFPRLTQMRLECFPNLKHLQVLVELPCLKELDLLIMPALESISGGPFPCW